MPKRIPGLQDSTPNPIPSWALDDKTPYPCPCGQPMGDSIIAYQGENEFMTLYHPECFAFYKDFRGEDDDD